MAQVIEEDLSKYTPEQRAEIEKLLGQKAKIEVKGIAKAEVTKEKAEVEVAGVSAQVDCRDDWSTVSMAVVLVLSVYLGIKLINKYIK